MACPSPAGCPEIRESLCRPLPPLLIDPTPDEAKLLWFFWYQGRSSSPCPYLPLLTDPNRNETLLRYYLSLIGCATDVPPLLEFGSPNLNLLANRPAGANLGIGSGGVDIVVAPLAINCGNNTIDCSVASPSLVCTASGGSPPYFWSATVGSIAVSGPNNNTGTLTPPATVNSFPGIAAYTKVLLYCVIGGPLPVCGGAASNRIAFVNFECDDVILGSCNDGIVDDASNQSGCPGGDPTGPCFPGACSSTCVAGPCTGTPGTDGTSPGPCITNGSRLPFGDACDKRTAAMILGGCKPCGLVMEGAVVTVTDSLGTMVSVTIDTL